MSHLSRDDLARWRDAPEERERERIVSHLAACDRCAGLYAELIRTRPADAAPARFDPRTFAERGRAAAAPSRRGVLAFRPRVTIPLAAAAAAAVILAVVLPGRLSPPGPEVIPTDALRGPGIEAASPVGEIAGAIEFSWTGGGGADRYAVEVLDASGRRVFYRETREGRLAADEAPGLDAALRAGVSYRWTVTALDSQGEAIARSAPRQFTRVSGIRR